MSGLDTTELQDKHHFEEPESAVRSPPSAFDRFSVLVVLTVFGVTWPVLDLLARNAEFFLARRSPKGEIVALGVIALVAAPLVIGGLGMLPGKVGPIIGTGLIVLGSVSLVSLYLERLPLPWWVVTVLSVVAGVALAWTFHRFPRSRMVGRYLLPAPLLLLGIYLFASPVGDVLAEPDARVGNPLPIANPVPVVMLVFDEFPLASIIEPNGDLRSDRYPNFARLAGDGIWFRNAMTVEQQTEHSVPAMLTGSVPDHSLVPITGQYPFNLFTGLRSHFELHAYESITQLCPRALCEGLTISVSSLVDDVSIIAGHVLLPQPLTEDLPPIDRGWGDFNAVADGFVARAEFNEELKDGPRRPINSLLEDIAAGSGELPPLYYLHAILPHHPWQFLPDGRSYPYIVSLNPAARDGGWNDDEFLVAQSQQRHLLQVGYADRVLGEVIAALEAQALYDEALVVMVADHGISFQPGVLKNRQITEESVGEIAAVPMFVKLPGNEQGGRIDDRRALTIDVLPTIAEVIEADLPGQVEGVSLLGPDPARLQTTTRGPDTQASYGADGAEKLEVAARIESLFPDGDPWALRPEGSPDLVGHPAPPDAEGSALSFRLTDPELYEDIDLEAAVVPARIGGILHGPVEGTEVLAVAVNGRTAAITRAYEFEGQASFLAMVNPDNFVAGENSIEVFEVTTGGEMLLVAPR
jgi:hypothetical protein